MAQTYDHSLKLLLLGDSGVGKSCLLVRYADMNYRDLYAPTIGVDFRLKTTDIEGESVRLQLWDTAGQERFRTITSTYYRGAHGIMIVFDLTSLKSFEHVKKWIQEAEKNCDQAPFIIVGNKCDLENLRVVTTKMGEDFASGYNASYIEVSAKANTFVEEAFRILAQEALHRKKGMTTLSRGPRSENIHLDERASGAAPAGPATGCCA